VDTDIDELRDNFPSYWGRQHGSNMPPYCKDVKYIRMDMNSDNVLKRLAKLVKDADETEPTQEAKDLFAEAADNIVQEMIIITHGTGGYFLGKVLALGHLILCRTTRWLALNVPRRKTIIAEQTPCNENLADILSNLASASRSQIDMSCSRVAKKDWHVSYVSTTWYDLEVSAALCGMMPSGAHGDYKYNKDLNELNLDILKKNTDYMKTMSDGVNRLDRCVKRTGGKIEAKYTLLSTNFWDGQLAKADPIGKKGARHWLHHTATKALEKLVNGKNPDLKWDESSKAIEEKYLKAWEKLKTLRKSKEYEYN